MEMAYDFLCRIPKQMPLTRRIQLSWPRPLTAYGKVAAETDPPLPTHKTYDYVAPLPSVKPRQELDYDPHLDPPVVPFAM
jgi:hypothetical protein